jgi:FdrA protein
VSVEAVRVQAGAYADSVSLMQVSQRVSAAEGVQAALIAMATPLNVGMVTDLGFQVPECGPNDLLIAVRADDAETLEAALAQVERAAEPSAGGTAEQVPPRTVGNALRSAAADLVLVSVPGQHAFTEAMDAVEAGCDVMIFSDNVPVEQEIRLKDAAGGTGALVMGPDCGTAIVEGTGLGFANAARFGPVGLVAASGTGAQHLTALLDLAGVGVSAVLGVGGRDLSAQVAGRATRVALRRLADDAGTEMIVVVSKPAEPAVAEALRAELPAKPVQFAMLGPGQPDLTAAAEACLRQLGRDLPEWPTWGAGRTAAGSGAVRGLFSGGTLCDEAMLILSAAVGEVRSNIPLRPEWALRADLRDTGHLCIDFGDDALTAGRAHPMIDPALRLERLRAELADPACAVVLLDVVLGFGAHPDPAGLLVPLVDGARPAVLISLIGTALDPQGLDQQAATLAGAGAEVFASNAQAARRALELIGAGT